MKTINDNILEKLIINKTFTDEKEKYFIYKLDKKWRIKIFDFQWKEFNTYKFNVYIDGLNIELDAEGYTKKMYEEGTHKIYIENIDNISNCANMFYKCNQLIEVPEFNTKYVRNMESMFYECTKLETVPLFNTDKVNNMEYMFCGCENLISVPKFITTSVVNMKKMFCDCKKIKTIPKFDTTNVQDMTLMFELCKRLESVPLFVINEETNLKNMFYNCNELNMKTKQEWSQIYDFDKHDKK